MTVYPPLPRPPTCWQFFGLLGPTNKHNLDEMYWERRAMPPFFVPLAQEERAEIEAQYRKCLADIGET